MSGDWKEWRKLKVDVTRILKILQKIVRGGCGRKGSREL